MGLPTGGSITSRLGGSYACLPVLSCPNGYINRTYFGTIPNFPGTNGTGYGNSGTGVLLGPGQFNFDASLTKTMVVGGLRENARLQFRSEFYNMFNHPQFGNPATAINSAASFGTITTTSVNPRLIQFGLKYLW